MAALFFVVVFQFSRNIAILKNIQVFLKSQCFLSQVKGNADFWFIVLNNGETNTGPVGDLQYGINRAN